MLKVANSVINASRITGVLPVVNGGTGVTTSTGTGNTVLSASPTFSGTAVFAALSASNTIAGATGTTDTFSTNSLAAASVSVPNSTATTIIAMSSFSLFNGVSLIVGGDEGNISFCAFVSQNGGGAYTLSNLINKNCTLSLSGANLQLTHTLGSTTTVKANSFLFAGR